VATIERSATKSQTEFSGSGLEVMLTTTSLSANKQLQRTVARHRGRAASASFHFALASLGRVHRAAAELRRYTQPAHIIL